jgi:predicted N-formylglutamate amidohydrolase
MRERLIEQYYRPYRHQVERHVSGYVTRGLRIIHVSSHSFTPRLAGVLRKADVGLLYDPARPLEARLCRHWQLLLRQRMPSLSVRRNYPYRGTSDGLTSFLRKRYPAERYLGIELELNQRHTRLPSREWRWLRAAVIAAFVDAVSELA